LAEIQAILSLVVYNRADRQFDRISAAFPLLLRHDLTRPPTLLILGM